MVVCLHKKETADVTERVNLMQSSLRSGSLGVRRGHGVLGGDDSPVKEVLLKVRVLAVLRHLADNIDLHATAAAPAAAAAENCQRVNMHAVTAS
jgi:hypothetical protein